MPKQLITFGESLFRLSTRRGERLREARNLDFHIGGSELNVAANFVSLGGEAAWLSVVPKDAPGELVLERLAHLGVDLSRIRRAGSEVGFYLVEDSTAPRPSRVPLRQKSSFSKNVAGAFDWKRELADAWVFHSSGITAGLGENSRNELKQAMEAAKQAKVLVSYDCNYRRTLWSESEAKEGQKDLLGLADILFCSVSDLKLFYGLEESSIEGFMRESGLQHLIVSRRDGNSSYGVDVYSRAAMACSRRFHHENTDQIGVGDSMTAGFFSALRAGSELQAIADTAAACGALKYSICGDMALLVQEEVAELLARGHRAILR